MEIRMSWYEPLAVAAVALAREGDELPRAVRVVDEATAAAVEELVVALGPVDLDGVDLDELVAEARARVAAG